MFSHTRRGTLNGSPPAFVRRLSALVFLSTIVAVVAFVTVSLPRRPSSLTGDVTGGGFKDQVPEWALPSALQMQQMGIVRGYEDGRFGAADPVTRGQLVTVLVRAFLPASTVPAPSVAAFTDVPASHFAYSPAARAREAGWLNGFANDLLYPDVPAARAEIAFLLARAMSATVPAAVPSGDALFPDVTAQTPYVTSIVALRDRGIMRGNPDGTYGPYSPVNRATLVTVLARSLGGGAAVSSITAPPVASSAAPSVTSSAASSAVPCPVCSLQHANATCASGTCAILNCTSGWGDADKQPGNGCEVSLSSDSRNCGTVGTVCTFPHTGTAVCVGGLCSIQSCTAGWMDVNGLKQDGCEMDVYTDALNCGLPGRHCPVPPQATSATCASGVCGYQCETGWEDVNKAPSDGCEVDLMNDLKNCGTAGTVCALPAHAIQKTCIKGSCSFVSCETNWINANGTLSDGCEVDTLTDVSHCGGKGVVCSSWPHASALCVNGTCEYVCASGYYDLDGSPYNGCESQ